MLRFALAAVVALFATAAAADDWVYDDSDVPIAVADNGAAQFQFACRGDLAMAFWVRAPHKSVAGATTIHVAITPDPKGSGTSLDGASFAQEIPLIHGDGAWVFIRGPVAKSWARIAQQAATTIRVAYVLKEGSAKAFDSNDFGAKGSSAAIAKVLARCG